MIAVETMTAEIDQLQASLAPRSRTPAMRAWHELRNHLDTWTAPKGTECMGRPTRVQMQE